ncbi:hypothetical protein FHR83_008754 [Actinoplanes campanulatus]|uniref:DUF1996 domain-containing protein n=1 Tax=Actinoplanes campanulatus TaxID=113559 RepID=A0A7W5ARC5_9ACTN|nr:DUF1996 domain-containing protein [Actinoplanes campanulatus]MBB3101026.1 hypothetical protein [Actinoplanes campanulatus]GGN49283.1 hypothetical protein GCM10010109_87170 [Actinoplanes campanulatus]GID41884.1 hypothetical protein Aca09nite_83900 [Actinoplanes campanulatus]
MKRRQTSFPVLTSRPARIAMAAAVLAATGALTVTFVSSGGNGTADAATSLAQFVPIQNVRPNVRHPRPTAAASTGRFTVNCGTNGNGKFSPDNPVAQPGIKNGAEHVHDFVGNLAITADSSDADLDASGTTCRNGDRSSYFWPVVRIDRTVRSGGEVQRALSETQPAVVCPSVRDRLPAVPVRVRARVDRLLADLDRLEAAANERMTASRGRIDAGINSRVLGSLRTRRAILIKDIGAAVTNTGGERPGMVSLVDCDVSYDGVHAAMHGTAHAASIRAGQVANPQIQCPTVRDKLPGVPDQALAEVNRNLDELDRQISEAGERLVTSRGQGGAAVVDNAVLGPLRAKRVAALDRIATAIGRQGTRPQGLDALAPCTLNPAPAAPATPGGAAALPEPQGPDFELPGNTGGIVRPAKVLIEYRGNPVSKVVPMPKFLRTLTGDAKPTSRGPANARATWTCSGFGDRLSDKYPICPAGRAVQRVHDFPGCWDGKNIDSDNHRRHVAFADKTTGACPQGFRAIPQLRITISYNIPRSVQAKGQYALDSFPEENHNPFSDHNDFINVNSARTMQRITTCINTGKRCS